MNTMAMLVKFISRDLYGTTTRFFPDTPNILSFYFGVGDARRFSADEIPAEAHVYSSHSKIPAFISINAHLAVSDIVRQRIEELEPDTHQFFPINLHRHKGKKPLLDQDGNLLLKPYYIINVITRIDSVIIDKSDVKIIDFKNLPCLVQNKNWTSPIYISKDMVAGKTVWMGRHHLAGHTIFSEEFFSYMVYSNWKGLDYFLLKEI